MADEERAKGTDTTEGGGKGAGATIKKTIVQMSKRIRRDFSIRRTTLGSREHFERRGD